MFNPIKLAVLSGLFLTSAANAAITISTVNWQDTSIPNPTSTSFKIDYRLFGSQFAQPSSQVQFYLTQDNGQTGYSIGSGLGKTQCGTTTLPDRCKASSSTNTHTVSTFNMDIATKNHLNSLCQPQDYKVVALYNGSSALSPGTASLGDYGRPDWLFTSGNMLPTVITPNGSVNVNFDLGNASCPGRGILPMVGIYLTDSDLNALYYFGNIIAADQSGSSHQFSLSFNGLGLPEGNYYVALVADINATSQETNENNNVGTFGFTVSGAQTQLSMKTQVTTQAKTQQSNVRSYIDPTPNNLEFAADFFSYGLPTTEGLNNQNIFKGSPIKIETISLPENK